MMQRTPWVCFAIFTLTADAQQTAPAADAMPPHDIADSEMTDLVAFGKPLWHFAANHAFRASPVTYMVGGKQYMSVTGPADFLTFGLP